MQILPVTSRDQSTYVPDPALVTPYAQNLTLAVSRSIRSNLVVDLRYVGTLARKQRSASNNINVPNFLYNGLKEAFDAARAGGESALLDQMLRGINLGAGTVGTAITGAAALRADTRFNSNLANGNYQMLAATLNTLNYASNLNPSLPPVGPGVNGTVLRVNGFPENFIVTNPQFTTINWISNNASNNYHSLIAQVTMRPTEGVNFQTTYTWSKNLGINAIIGALGATFTNPTDRAPDYTLMPDSRTHDFRTSGTFELPIGPGRPFLGNSSGVLARVTEGWRMSWIFNSNTGAPISIAAANMLYANGTPDIVGPFDPKSGTVSFTGGPTGNYFSRELYKQVLDPQCASVTTTQNLRNLCTLSAVADTKTNQILLQNPLPGTRGTLGQRIVEGPGVWRVNSSLSKSIRISETKNLEIRMDATNIFNHPEPSAPSLDINNANFGLIVGTGGTPTAKNNQRREFQGQIRLNF
jgi:hypothetical protein